MDLSEEIPSGGGPLVFVDDLAAPVLAPDDHHHLSRVRRVRAGDPVVLGDGAGSWVEARFAADRPEVVGGVRSLPAPTPSVGVGFALTKGAKPELAVQKLTELGVDRIVPFVAARSVVRWDSARADAAHQRLVKVAREAAMQSRRAWLPEVSPVTPFAEVVGREAVVLAERGGGPPRLDGSLVLIGPEGGWDPAELAIDAPQVAFASTVLRAETAAIVAGAVLVGLRSGTIAPA